MVGLLLTGVFVATVAAVLMLMAEISREHQQGGRVAAGSSYATGRPLRPIAVPAARQPTCYVGRHRR